jgi:hypothetical protein
MARPAMFFLQHPMLLVQHQCRSILEGAMNFIFMLTRRDHTVADCLETLDLVSNLGVRHIGFKDVGAPTQVLKELDRRIKAAGAVSYMEVVSETPDRARQSLSTARDIGVDKVLGGTDLAAASEIFGDLSCYFPFAGRPVGHPTRLEGSAALVAEHCRACRDAGCGGVDLLAYRATEAEPLDLVRSARQALGNKLLIVAGSVNSPDRIHDLARAGADAFTIGSAALDGSFSPTKGSLRSQIADIMAACQTQAKVVA